jgi:hypothetical protein
MAKHPKRGMAITLSVAKHLPERRPTTTTTKHPSDKKLKSCGTNPSD